MQYHLNGFRSGDPSVAVAADDAGAQHDEVDVLIVGCGPAGLTLAAQLSAFPEIVTRIVEVKSGPLEFGQADGIACRSMEMFEAFGFAEKVAKEAYWVSETTFWRPGADGVGLRRADRIQDVEDDLSEFPHVILSQARVHDFFLERMRNSPRRLTPDYNLRLIDVEITDDDRYPVTATLERSGSGTSEETIRARFVIGCDGARSTVRRAMGHELRGEAARQLWGVMDVLATTDFPDIRLKTAIQSANQGSLLIIPREGGYLVRMYIELDELRGDERAADRNVTSEALIDQARAILSPHTLEVRQVAWFSAYEIGQRICDGFDNVAPKDRGQSIPRIFIVGDACHTHSPKAGQGMNVSMADAFNLGWKLAAVVEGRAHHSLLDTYSAERHAKAQELIDFDRDIARLFSEKPTSPEEAERFQRYFQKHGRYTAGVETRYDPSPIVGGDEHQELARGLIVGMRFHSAPVIRLADAKPMQLGHVLKADGRWRIVAFADADDRGGPGQRIASLCSFLSDDATSPIRKFTPRDADVDAVIDVRAVFQIGHRELALDELPYLLLPSKGRFGLTDYGKVFCPDTKNGRDIFEMRRIDREHGVMVVVRPDQYIAGVLALDDFDGVARLFNGFMTTSAVNPGRPESRQVGTSC